MTDEGDTRKGNLVGKDVRQAAAYRLSAKVDARTGRTPVGLYAADLLDAKAATPLRLGLETDGTGAGGELIIRMPGSPGDAHATHLKNTVADPSMVTASATLDRLRLAEDARALDLALDAAETIAPKNSLEKMLAHQLASAHQLAMRMAGLANDWAARASPGAMPQGITAAAMMEAQRAANTAARLMGAYQDGMLTLARIRGGGKQTVVVQHVQVNDGGRAVVAGKVGRGGRKRRGG